jgi:hypothetical protein
MGQLKKKKETEKGTPKQEFIRKQPLSMSPNDVKNAGEVAGFKFSASYVGMVRQKLMGVPPGKRGGSRRRTTIAAAAASAPAKKARRRPKLELEEETAKLAPVTNGHRTAKPSADTVREAIHLLVDQGLLPEEEAKEMVWRYRP